MRLVVILTVVLGLLGFSAFKVYSWFDEKTKAGKEMQSRMAQTPPPVPSSTTVADRGPAIGEAPTAQTVVGSYRFKNRLAPEAPGFLRDDTKVGMIVQREMASNSWVWIGGPVLGSQILDLAESYDVEQIEMDLEFVLVLLSTDKLKARGLSIFYQERATWLNALSLVGDAGSLRISSGGWGVDLSYTDTDSGLSLLSQPVIRCVEGHEWTFANDSEVPVPRSEIVDGTIRNSVEFRPVGFALEGVVRIVGDRVLLQVDQRNGSIAPATAGGSEVPIINSQTLRTTVHLAFWEWSVLGGIQIDREQLRRGLFRHSVQATSDYLVIFVRPRLALEAPARAVPVDSVREVHPLLEGAGIGGPGVLPSLRDPETEEADFLRDYAKKRRGGHPAGK